MRIPDACVNMINANYFETADCLCALFLHCANEIFDWNKPFEGLYAEAYLVVGTKEAWCPTNLWDQDTLIDSNSNKTVTVIRVV